jgi:hypothetical protein
VTDQVSLEPQGSKVISLYTAVELAL